MFGLSTDKLTKKSSESASDSSESLILPEPAKPPVRYAYDAYQEKVDAEVAMSREGSSTNHAASGGGSGSAGGGSSARARKNSAASSRSLGHARGDNMAGALRESAQKLAMSSPTRAT